LRGSVGEGGHAVGIDVVIAVQRADFLTGQQLLKILRRHGAAKIVALHIAGAQILQIVRLLPGLYALGDDGQPQPVGHADDGAEDIAGAGLVPAAAEKAHIQLQKVHRHVLEHIQRGIAAAEIIHFNLEPAVAQFLDDTDQCCGVLRINTLRNLKVDILRLQPMFFDHLR